MRFLSTLCALVAALLSLSAAHAEGYPSKTVRIVVPYQPGQGTDVATRFLAEHLGKAMGQPVVVDNRPGAGGNIGAAEASRAAPDGYTLLMGTNGTHVLNQFLYPSMGFEPERDFQPVVLVSSFPMVFLASPGAKVNSVAELLAASDAQPESVTTAMPSTTARLVLELLKQQRPTTVRGIPYQGSSTAMTDLIGGQVLVSIDTVSASRSFIASGKLKPLGVTSLKPTALLPGVKPLAEQGLDGFQVLAWNGLYAPRGTPTAVVTRLNAEVNKLLAQPEVRQRLLELGHEPAGGAAGELGDFARAERAKWGPVVAKAGLKAD